MKLVTLVRHAKSSWQDSRIADIDRPLNDRGTRDAPVMGQRLADAGVAPERIISSPAVRALETARVLVEGMRLDPAAIITEPCIYGASGAQLLELLRHQPARVGHVMLVGHSPAIADLGYTLCGTPQGKFPTCGVLRIRLGVEGWWEAAAGRGELILFDYPKKGA